MTSLNRNSPKPIPLRERLIFALDVSTPNEARRLIGELGDAVVFYKLGLQLFMAGGYYDLIEWMRGQGKKVFVDLKFFDVPETVKLAGRPASTTAASSSPRCMATTASSAPPPPRRRT